MACYRPLSAFVDGDGRVSFEAPGRPLFLPCGKCVGCKMARARAWALRIVHESQLHARNCFVTLTYDNDSLPKDGSVHVEDWQKFAKRLRKAIGPFRFFHCGEYGERNFRPHYHACMFGIDFGFDRVLLRRSGESALYASRLLADVWGRGHCSIGNLSYESAAYVARYVVKKQGSRPKCFVDFNSGELREVRPEYVTMSRRPGIGSNWYDKYKGDVFPSDEVVHSGRKYSAPRYYFDKLSSELPVLASSLKAKRIEAMSKRSEDSTADRLRVSEAVAEARLRLLSRDL